MAIGALGLAAPGFALLAADQLARDDDGFLMSPEQTFHTSTYAITSGDQQLLVDAPPDLTPGALLGDLKLTATGADGSAVFLGIGPAANVETYLAGVEHATLVEIRDGEAVYRTTAGSGPSERPSGRGLLGRRGVGHRGPGDHLDTRERRLGSPGDGRRGQSGRGRRGHGRRRGPVSPLGRRNPALARRDRSGPVGGPHRGSAAEGLARRW